MMEDVRSGIEEIAETTEGGRVAQVHDLRFDWITTREAFAGLRDGWTDLALTASTVFLTHSWLANWADHLGTSHELRVLVAWQGDRLVGALPLCATVRSRARVWEFMGVGTLTPNHLDVLALPEFRAAVLEGVAGRLLATAGEWDVLELDKLVAGSGTAGLLHERFSAEGLATSLDTTAVCPYVPLPPTYDEYISSLGTRMQRHLRADGRRLEREHPEVRYTMASGREEVARAMDFLIAEHQARWRGEKGYPGAFADKAVVAFHMANVIDADTDGSLRLSQITCGDEFVAVDYSYRVGRRVQTYQCSFNPAFSLYGPGVLSRGRAVLDSIGEGASEYDFLEGDEPYKAKLGAYEKRENVRVRVYRRTTAAAGARLASGISVAAGAVARQVLPPKLREGLLKRVKRLEARGEPRNREDRDTGSATTDRSERHGGTEGAGDG